MKRLFNIVLLVGMIGMGFTAGTVQAQPSGEPSPLVGDFRVQAALVLCDALMLNPAKTEKIVAKYQEIGEKRRQEWQDSGTDFQSMSNEERQKFFSDYRKKVAADMKKGVTDILSEKEINEVEAIMMITIFSPDPELRGLRLIELKDEQRQKIQPLSIALGKKIVPGRFGFFGAQMDDAEREKADKAFEDEKKVFLTKTNEILSDEQKKAWKEKVDAINKELEEIRERMRNSRNQ